MIVPLLQFYNAFEQDVVLSNDQSVYPVTTVCVVYAVPSGMAWGYQISVKTKGVLHVGAAYLILPCLTSWPVSKSVGTLCAWAAISSNTIYTTK